MALKNLSMQINAAAQSIFTVDGSDKAAASFSGFISPQGLPSTSKKVEDWELYSSNKDAVDEDYKAFDTYMDNLIVRTEA